MDFNGDLMGVNEWMVMNGDIPSGKLSHNELERSTIF